MDEDSGWVASDVGWHCHLDAAALLLPEMSEVPRALIGERRLGAAGEHRRRPAAHSRKRLWGHQRVDAAVDLKEQPASEAVFNRHPSQTEIKELGSSDDPVPASSQPLNLPQRNSLLFTCHNM